MGNRKTLSVSPRGNLRRWGASAPCSPALMGGRWAALRHGATGSRAGAQTHKNTHSQPCSVLELPDRENTKIGLGPVLSEFHGLAAGLLVTAMHLIGNICVRVCVYLW